MEVELTALQRRGCVGVGLAQSTVVQGALEHLVHEGRQPVIRRGAKDSVTDNGIALTPKSLTDTVNRPAKTLDDWFTSFFSCTISREVVIAFCLPSRESSYLPVIDGQMDTHTW